MSDSIFSRWADNLNGVRPDSALQKLSSVIPGLLLTSAITGVAFSIRQHPSMAMVSPVVWALAIGILVRPLTAHRRLFDAGISFSLRWILRLAIVVLGLQLSLSQIALIGLSGAIIVVISTISTFYFTIWLGTLLRVDPPLTHLIASGTSICGASAIVSANTIVKADEEDVVYALASITAFGTLLMVIFPWLTQILILDDYKAGVWTGSSIHEVAQVVGAAFAINDQAGEYGTIAKLGRVLMLAPMTFALSMSFRPQDSLSSEANAGTSSSARTPLIPWFVIGFALMVILGNVVSHGNRLPYVPQITLAMLTISLAALGLKSEMRKLLTKGLRPAFLGAGSTLFISGVSYLLIMMIL